MATRAVYANLLIKLASDTGQIVVTVSQPHVSVDHVMYVLPSTIYLVTCHGIASKVSGKARRKRGIL